MKKKPSFFQRLRYTFDNTLTYGPAALILWLVLATATLIVIAIALDIVIGGVSNEAGLGPREVIWNIVFQALVPNPPGNLDSPWQFLVVMFGVTVASLAMVSILIGLLSATIQSRIDTLRRGRSQVIESNHTVILGWSEQVFPIVSQLVIANVNQRQSAIAILGDKDKIEMEEDLRQRIKSTGHTRVVCRRGSPTQHADLDLVSPQTSKSIIVLADDDDELPDATTIKTILALVNASDRRPQPYQIVAVLRKASNLEIARLVGGAEAELVLSGDVIARLMAQTCRQPGLSTVYTELLDFEGDEIYFKQEPALAGKSFGDALFAYEDSTLIGIRMRDGASRLLPPMETIFEVGDEVIAISKDDDTVRLSGAERIPIQNDAIETGPRISRKPEHILILGWNWRARTVIHHLDAYMPPGSVLTIAALHPTAESEINELKQELTNAEIQFQTAEISSRPALDNLQLAIYDHIIVLAYSDSLEAQKADALTLLTLLHVRRIAEECRCSFSLVSEMMDLRNRELAESTRANDFIVSDRVISLILAQVSENRALNRILDDLLDPGGAEIYSKLASEYVKPGVEISFYTVVQAARARGEVAIGYRLKNFEGSKDRTYGVVLNPAKSALVTFGQQDRVFVLAESE